MFNAFSDRISAYSLGPHVGLISFASTVDVLSPIVSSVELFRDKLDLLRPRGDTFLYDAVVKAAEMLQAYPTSKQLATTIHRIIVLTDGKNTGGEATLHTVKALLAKHR